MQRAIMVASNRLVFLAVSALDEAIDAARGGRVAPSLGLRLALAYLYSVGDRRTLWFDREPYDDFWRLVTSDAEPCDGANTSAASYSRQIALTASMNGMALAAGLELTPDITAKMRRARSAR